MKKKSEINFCKKCLLPETYPKLRINGKGVCNACESHQNKYSRTEGFLPGAINGTPAVVTVSGGLDGLVACIVAMGISSNCAKGGHC